MCQRAPPQHPSTTFPYIDWYVYIYMCVHFKWVVDAFFFPLFGVFIAGDYQDKGQQ